MRRESKEELVKSVSNQSQGVLTPQLHAALKGKRCYVPLHWLVAALVLSCGPIDLLLSAGC
jgi:hypothetical protein